MVSEQELSDVLQVAWPVPEAGSCDRALAAMAEARQRGATWPPSGRRFALVGTAAVLALVAVGVRGPLTARHARLVLASAAEAAVDASHQHVRAILTPPSDSEGSVLGDHDWQEVWISPAGRRTDLRTRDGELQVTRGTNVTGGYAWWYDAERETAVIFWVPSETLREDAGRSATRSGHLMDSREMAEHIDQADTVSIKHARLDGEAVTQVTLLYRASSTREAAAAGRLGASDGYDVTEEYLIDEREGLLVGMRGYAELPEGRTLMWEDRRDYGEEMEPETFEFSPPAGVKVCEVEGAGEWGVCDCRRLPWNSALEGDPSADQWPRAGKAPENRMSGRPGETRRGDG